MGANTSRVVNPRSARNGLVITFDALGTLYGFKEPVASQYLRVAQLSGLTTQISTDDIDRAFREVYKAHTRALPNYGARGMISPETWWTILVEKTFQQLTEKVPANLGKHLYEHFSSSDAYTLYSDTLLSLNQIRDVRHDCLFNDVPMVIVGVITNSDPRVTQVLQQLKLQLNSESLVDQLKHRLGAGRQWDRHGMRPSHKTLLGHYQPSENHLDFVVSSYNSQEKPHADIFEDAEDSAAISVLSRKLQHHKARLDPVEALQPISKDAIVTDMLSESLDDVRQMAWVHVGDEEFKDYRGARDYGFEALLLDRDGKYNDRPGVISSLQEAVLLIGSLVREARK